VRRQTGTTARGKVSKGFGREGFAIRPSAEPVPEVTRVRRSVEIRKNIPKIKKKSLGHYRPDVGLCMLV